MARLDDITRDNEMNNIVIPNATVDREFEQ